MNLLHRSHAAFKHSDCPKEHILKVTASIRHCKWLCVDCDLTLEAQEHPDLVTSPASFVKVWSPVRPTTTCTA